MLHTHYECTCMAKCVVVYIKLARLKISIPSLRHSEYKFSRTLKQLTTDTTYMNILSEKC